MLKPFVLFDRVKILSARWRERKRTFGESTMLWNVNEVSNLFLFYDDYFFPFRFRLFLFFFFFLLLLCGVNVAGFSLLLNLCVSVMFMLFCRFLDGVQCLDQALEPFFFFTCIAILVQVHRTKRFPGKY